ncbi:alpha-mannosidase [Enterococcus sp. CU9D]|nr:alpha-mannosidase [Enterococcus sp. CU9D]KAF1290738.1 alpha-mannosidase [Enterococcus sp. CU9D]
MMNLTFAEDKLRGRIDALKELRYRNKLTLTDWFVKEDSTKEEKYPPTDFTSGQAFSLDSYWKGRDFYLWIQREVEIPNHGELLFLFDIGKTGGGYNSGFESLLFINGKPYQGVDSNHQEVFLDQDLLGKKLDVALRLWSGLEGGGPEQVQKHEFRRAELVELDRETDGLYYLSDVVLNTIQELDGNDPVRYQLLDILNRAYLEIDWSYPGNESFYDSIKKAASYLSDAVDDMEKDGNVVITAVGHTHIDVAWLWRLKHTREKAARSFSTVLKLMERYPEYVFLQTQPQLYKYIKTDYPEIYAKIKERVAQGRWEVDGAMWLESDCNIPSGESLTRQILHGSKFIKEEFGQEVNYLWLPDVFGYSWALPQILKKSGIDTFMTTKISWNQFNRMPHDTFIWKGMDGSEVLTHFITTPEPKPHASWASEWFYTYNGLLEPQTVLGAYRGYRDKDINHELLISYGYGDGGGGVTRDMLEKRRQMDRVPGLPEVKTGRAKEFFEKLHETIETTDHYVHEWDGELYLEYHRGTYTSQGYVKKMNRKTELALRELEMLYSFGELQGIEYPKEQLFEMWEVLLRNQFHDIIPGSSIKEVYQDHKKEFQVVTEEKECLFEKLQQETEKLLVVNTAAWSRNTIVELPKTEHKAYQDDQGNVYEVIKEKDESYLRIPEIKGLSDLLLVPTLDKLKEVEVTAQKSGNTLETPYYILHWDSTGHFTRLFDKEHQREVLKGKGNVLQVFEDKPKDYDAWDIDIFYQEKMVEIQLESSDLTANNSLFAELTFNGKIGESQLTQKVRFYRHSRRIDFITDVDWRERQRLLKVAFDVDVRATEATYDIQYGNVKRPNHWNTSWDMAKFETVGHQWADLSERNYGVSLLNDCKYGYDIKGTVLRLSLLKGGIYPDPTADIGQHAFTYSLLPHDGDFLVGKTIQEAWEINEPLTLLKREECLLPKLGIEISGGVTIDAFKKAENSEGWILRLHDYSGGRSSVKLILDRPVDWCYTNLMERNESEWATASAGKLQLDIHPYEVVTLRLQ